MALLNFLKTVLDGLENLFWEQIIMKFKGVPFYSIGSALICFVYELYYTKNLL